MQVGCCVNDPAEFSVISDWLRANVDGRICVQVFVRQPTVFKDVHSADELVALGKWAKSSRHTVFVHGAYVSAPWGGARGSLYNMGLEMALCAQIGASGYIVHLAPGCRQRALLVAVLSRIGATGSTPRIYFEVNATKASATSFFTVDALGDAFDLITEVADLYRVGVGLCIDTAHMFAGGVSFAEYEPTRAYLARLVDRVRVPIMFHLNDSYEPLGSGRDRHAELGKGNIWGGQTNLADSGLRAIIEFAYIHKSAVVLEQDWMSVMPGILGVLGVLGVRNTSP